MKTATLVALALVLAPMAAHAQSFDEQDVVNDLNALRMAVHATDMPEHWVQPVNRKEKCSVVITGSEAPTNVKWYGSCANGKASGIGITIAQLGEKKAIALEEYRGATIADNFTYRQIMVEPPQTFIFDGVSNAGSLSGKVALIGKSPKGNPSLTEIEQTCAAGECVTLRKDLSGSVGYSVRGNNGYDVRWIDFRADGDSLLLTRKQLEINGITRAESIVLDGVKYDVGAVVQTGKVERLAAFGPLGPILDSPYTRYLDEMPKINAAIAESESKIAAVHATLCAKPSNEDIRRICDPALIKPTDLDLVAARGESNQIAMQVAAGTRSQRDQGNAAAANAAQAQAAYAAQQAQIEAARRQQNHQALMQGIQALNQVGINAQQMNQQLQQTIQLPQVQGPTPPGRSGVACRTIGYMTYCN